MKSYIGNSIHLLSSMSQPAMTAYVLRRLRASAAFLGPMPHLTRKLLRMALKLFGAEEPGPRLQVRVRVCCEWCMGCACTRVVGARAASPVWSLAS